mmetsp:Transcript_35060/g.67404  ORF Transcript_35060/g.67404 Transcript_35060/m.67404 type:complete len:864 (+) Transcript_35060:221-2812(+)
MAGKSVFQLSYEEAAYNSDCWQIMMYMLVFVMIVDTTQRLVGRFAEGDRVTEMFVSRLESELLMFGAIALVVFFLDQGLNPLVLSDKMYKLVKFADIIVSIAAILLIVVGCWAYLLLLRARRHYHQLTVRRIAEYAHPEERAETSIYHECWRKLGYGKRLQEDIDFLVGAGNITLMLHAPLDVEFGAYCSEVVGQVIINLIDINLISWLASFAVVAVLFSAVGGTADEMLPVTISIVFGVVLLVSSAALVIIVRLAQHNLRKLYGYDLAHEKELQAALDEEVEISMRSEDIASSVYSGRITRATAGLGTNRSEPVRPSRQASPSTVLSTQPTAGHPRFQLSNADAHQHTNPVHSHVENKAAVPDGENNADVHPKSPAPPSADIHEANSPTCTVATEEDLAAPSPILHYDGEHTHALQLQPIRSSSRHDHAIEGTAGEGAHHSVGFVTPPAPLVVSQHSAGQQSLSCSMHACAAACVPACVPSLRSHSLPAQEPQSVSRVSSLQTRVTLVDLHSKQRSSWIRASQNISERLRNLGVPSLRRSQGQSEHAAESAADVVAIPISNILLNDDVKATISIDDSISAGANTHKALSSTLAAVVGNKEAAGCALSAVAEPASSAKAKRRASALAPPMDGFSEAPPLSLKLWVARHMTAMGQMLQIVMLLTCGLLAFYFVHLVYNINHTNVGPGWHVAVMLPPLVTLLVLLPDAVHHFGVFEAYAVPNVSVLDHVITDAEQREADLRMLRTVLEQRLCTPGWPEYLRAFEANFESSVWERIGKLLLDLGRGRTDFFLKADHCFVQAVLAAAKIDMSRERLIRIIGYIDEELEGEDICLDGLLNVIGLSMPPACEQVRIAQPPFEGGTECVV